MIGSGGLKSPRSLPPGRLRFEQPAQLIGRWQPVRSTEQPNTHSITALFPQSQTATKNFYIRINTFQRIFAFPARPLSETARMTARQIRRAQEHKERKLAYKPAKAAATDSAAAQTSQAPAPFSQARLDANRANAQSSTGPRTEEGKAISSLNNLRHGFNGAFCVLPSENTREFIGLMDDLHAEHKPVTPTERLLVMDMVRHYWLLQRALRLQQECFTRGLDDVALEKQLGLYMRYQTTNQRAFHRCLNELQRLRKQKPADQVGFESQKAEPAPAGKPDRSASVPEPPIIQVNGVGSTLSVGLESQNTKELSRKREPDNPKNTAEPE